MMMNDSRLPHDLSVQYFFYFICRYSARHFSLVELEAKLNSDGGMILKQALYGGGHPNLTVNRVKK